MKVVYYANDGKKFDDRDKCESYEKSLDKEKEEFDSIVSMISLYNKKYKKNLQLYNSYETIEELFDSFINNNK